MAFHGGHLDVAEQHRILRFPAQGLAPDRPIDAAAEVIFDRLPDKVHHGWRYIGFGPDEMLYVTVGVACNICDAKEPEGTILRMDPDGANVATFAHGIRNSVGFDFQPDIGVLHFTDNGTDDMGDNEPPCEINAAPEAGMHFGFPYYAGGHARHPDWADRQPPQEVTFRCLHFRRILRLSEYTVIALRAYGTGERPDPTGIMAEIGKTLSEDEMRALAAHAENLSQ